MWVNQFRETSWDASLLRLSTNALLIFRGLHTFCCCLCCLICFVQIIFFIKVVKVHHGEDDIVKFVGDIEQITPEQVFYLYAVFFRVLIRSRKGKIPRFLFSGTGVAKYTWVRYFKFCIFTRNFYQFSRDRP